MKKILAILISFIMIISLAGCSEEKAALNMLLDAAEKAANWDNYNMKIESYMKIDDPLQGEMEISTSGEGTVFMDPMKLYMNMSVDFTDLDQTQHIEQYMLQEEEAVILYQYVQGQWYKMHIAIDGLEDILQSDPARDIQLMMEYTKSAKIAGEEMINERKAYVMDLSVSMEIYKEIMKKNEAIGSMVPLVADENLDKALSEMEDLQYTLWIDKESGDIVKYSMDLGKMMGILMSQLDLEEITKEEKDMFKNMEMTTTMFISNQNKAENFELPQEALDAIDMGDSFE